MSVPEDVSFSDEEFARVRAKVERSCSLSLGLFLYQEVFDLIPAAIFDLIPEPFQEAILDTDPKQFPVQAGESIGQAIGLEDDALLLFSAGFANRVWNIASEQIKSKLRIKNSALPSSTRAEFEPQSNAIIAAAERLANSFTLPDLTPTRARRLIAIAATDIDKED